MAISDKLTYLNETKTQLKNMINYGLDNDNKITNQTTFRNYVSSTFKAFIESLNNPNTIWGNLPKITGEGKEITLNNTIEAPMKIELNPSELEQKTTTGKNLLNLNTQPLYYTMSTSSFNEPNVEITKTAQNANCFCLFTVGDVNTLNGKTLKYTGNLLSGYGRAIIGYADANGNNRVVGAGNENINPGVFEWTMTVDGTTYANKKVVVWLYADVASAGNIGDKLIYKNVMVSESGGDYEPYTNGASPNPSYPQQIHTISGDNEIKICNENLLDLSTLHQGLYKAEQNPTIDYTTDARYRCFALNLSQGTYTINFDKLNHLVRDFTSYDYSGNDSLGIATNNITSKTFTMAQNGIVYLSFRKSDGNNWDDANDKVWLVKGSTPTTYIEHQEQVKEINLGNIEYCEIGDYKDDFIRNSGKNKFNTLKVINVDSNTTYQNVSNNSVIVTSTGNYDYRNVRYEIDNIKPNTNYTFKAKFSNSNSNITKLWFQVYGVNSSSMIQNSNYESNAIVNFNSGNNTNLYIRIYATGSTATTNTATWTEIELVEGTYTSETMPNFEPYGKDQWYIKKNIGKVVLDGSEDEGWELYNSTSTRTAAYITVNNIKDYTINDAAYPPKLLSSHFISISQNDTWLPGNISMRYQDNERVYFCFDSSYTDTNSIKNWFSNNNTTLYYVLATPTYTLLNDTLQTQLEDIYNTMKSYNGQTNISQVNNDLGFNISSSALEDLIG